MSSDNGFRRILGSGDDHTPSLEQREAARSDLHAAYVAEQPRRQHDRRLVFASAAAVAAAVVAFVIAIPGGSAPLDANLAEIARAARSVDSAQLPAGTYVYFRTEITSRDSQPLEAGGFVDFLRRETIDTWAQGNTAREVRTIGQPIFDSAAEEAAFLAAGLDAAIGVGQTEVVEVVAEPNVVDPNTLPTDSSDLEGLLRSELGRSDFIESTESRLFAQAVELLNPRFNASPQLRAAALELIGRLGVETSKTADGMVRVRAGFIEGGGQRLITELHFDSSGFLRLERQTAEGDAGTPPHLLFEIRYSVPAVVSNAFEVPAG